MSHHSRDRILGLVLLGLCLAGWLYLGTLPSRPALFPRLIFAGTSVLAVLLFVGTFFGRPSLESVRIVGHAVRLGTVAFLTALYFLSIDWIGFFTSTFAFVALLAVALGYRRALVILVTSLGFTAFVYVIFDILFNRPLPAEFFQRW